MQYNYGKNMFTGRVPPIQLIGDPVTQHPDMWSSTVHVDEFIFITHKMKTIFFLPPVAIIPSLRLSTTGWHTGFKSFFLNYPQTYVSYHY
jgi:hypothetical protein